MKLPLPLLPLAASAALPPAQPTTNLPDVAPGVFNISTRISIRSTVPEAWAALTDFPSYPAWNPFVRSSVVVSPWTNLSLPDQRPTEGATLLLRTQIPPLPLPVSAHTPDNILHTQYALEKVVVMDEAGGRLAWEYATDALVQGRRWQAVSDGGDGTVLYESREVFSGVGAKALEKLLAGKLQEAFEAQGEGLRVLLEGEEGRM